MPSHERQWRRTLGSGTWAFVAEWERKLVGFASGGLSRVRRDITGEIYVLYVLRAFQGRADRPRPLRRLPLRTRPLRPPRPPGLVLADNPSRGFYEHLGGLLAGDNEIVLGGARLKELAYVWPD